MNIAVTSAVVCQDVPRTWMRPTRRSDGRTSVRFVTHRGGKPALAQARTGLWSALQPGPGSVGAVAVEGQEPDVRYIRWATSGLTGGEELMLLGESRECTLLRLGA
jgi:hypothetical protein